MTGAASEGKNVDILKNNPFPTQNAYDIPSSPQFSPIGARNKGQDKVV